MGRRICAIAEAWLVWKKTMRHSVLEINICEKKGEEAEIGRGRSRIAMQA